VAEIVPGAVREPSNLRGAAEGGVERKAAQWLAPRARENERRVARQQA
jgi:hypothetical protein